MTEAVAGGQGSPNPPAPDAAAVKAAADKATADAATKAAADKAVADKGKTPEQIAAEAKTAADAAAAASKPPDKYELKLPAGDWLDDGDLKRFEGFARTKGMNNEQAQAAIEEHADDRAAVSAAFRTETEKDPTYGGDNLAETQRLANLALDKVRPADTPEGKQLRTLLARTGYGNNLAVVSFLADLGKQMAEDSPPAGRAGGGGAQPIADQLYPSTVAGKT